MKTSIAFFTVLFFAASMLVTSCNKPNPPTSEGNVPDTALTDSIPPSGEDEYQQDVAPQGRTEQIDSIGDSIDRKP